MKIPVLLLAYNRPRQIKKILKYLNKIGVNNIFISIDGPKNNQQDKKSNQEIKGIIKLIKNRNLKVNYLKKNYGCKIAVEKGINWFFSNVDKGVILEDDCMPNKSFFNFCKTMLKKYENTRVKVISGNNFLEKKIKINNHCYFSKFNHCWGWATWKSAWKLYDGNFTNWKKLKKSNSWNNLFTNKIDQKYWEKIFDLSSKKYFDSWAYPWLYSIWYNNGCTIIPKYNLVKNLGDKGTHNSFYAKLDYPKYKLSSKFIFPKEIVINEEADDYVMKNFFIPKNLLWPNRLIYLLKRFVLNPIIFIKIVIKKRKNVFY